MFKYLALIGAFFSSTLYATDCHKNPVYCHIIRIAPKTPNAMELSNSIARAGKKYGVDPHILVAIGMQESTLRPIHRIVGVVDASSCKLKITDYGMFQINEHTIPIYKLDQVRLLVDVDYQIDSGARVLADKLRMFGDYASYHSMTPKHRERYRLAVGRYL